MGQPDVIPYFDFTTSCIQDGIAQSNISPHENPALAVKIGCVIQVPLYRFYHERNKQDSYDRLDEILSNYENDPFYHRKFTQ